MSKYPTLAHVLKKYSEESTRSEVEKFVSFSSIAQACGITQNTVKEWVKQGRIPYPEVEVKGKRFFSKGQGEDILRYIREMKGLKQI